MKQFLSYLFFVGWCSCLTFCSQTDEDNSPLREEGAVRVAFVLDLDNQQEERSDFRTTVEQIGKDFETWIKGGSLQVLIFTGKDENGQYVGRVKDLTIVSLSGQDYRIQGISSVALKVGSTYRFMVMANCGTAMEIPSGEGPDFSLPDLQEEQGSLPLWGMTSHTVDFSPMQYLEPVHLLRGVAKIVVKLSPELQQKGYRLSDVRLSHAAIQGYAFPRKWQSAAFTAEVMSGDGGFHPHPASAIPVFLQPGSADSSEYVTYVPEYDHLENGMAARLSLKARWDHMEEQYEDAIEFKHYVDGKAEEGTLYNLVRNHTYEFVIRQIAIGHRLWLESQVLPWTVEEESWDYTDHVSVRSEGKLQWVKGTYERIDRATGTVVMRPGTPMVCSFLLDTPVKAQWYASFIPMSGMTDNFRFETFATEGGRQATGKVGEPATLRITSLSPAVDQNNVARLRIVVQTQGGRTILVKNLLPDEFQDITEYTIVQSK